MRCVGWMERVSPSAEDFLEFMCSGSLFGLQRQDGLDTVAAIEAFLKTERGEDASFTEMANRLWQEFRAQHPVDFKAIAKSQFGESWLSQVASIPMQPWNGHIETGFDPAKQYIIKDPDDGMVRGTLGPHGVGNIDRVPLNTKMELWEN